MNLWNSRFVGGCRTVHIYTAMFAVPLLLFFALTGFMLSHGDWFSLTSPNVCTEQGNLPEAVLWGMERDQIIAELRNCFELDGEVNSFDVSDDEVRVVFKRPGYRAEAIIHVADGRTELTVESAGISGRAAELHKGTQTGRWWWLCQDLAAAVLGIAVITGTVLGLATRKRRLLGMAALAVGSAAALVIYWLSVP